MFEEAKLVSFYTETPVHAGSGTSLGVVDLPIQRESHTDLPMIQASGIKGAFRELAEGLKKKLNGFTVEEIFGPKDGNEHAGALAFTDARLLLFPIRSLKGIFVWATCPFLLERLARDAERCGNSFFEQEVKISEIKDNEVGVDNKCIAGIQNKFVVLEDFSFEVKSDNFAQQIGKSIFKNAFPLTQEYQSWEDKFLERFVILSDTAFSEFTRLSTQVVARIRMNDKGTVERGGLWYEEALPPETLLYSIALAAKTKNGSGKPAKEVLKVLENTILKDSSRIQFGGDATVGRGYVNVRVAQNDAPSNGGEKNDGA